MAPRWLMSPLGRWRSALPLVSLQQLRLVKPARLPQATSFPLCHALVPALSRLARQPVQPLVIAQPRPLAFLRVRPPSVVSRLLVLWAVLALLPRPAQPPLDSASPVRLFDYFSSLFSWLPADRRPGPLAPDAPPLVVPRIGLRRAPALLRRLPYPVSRRSLLARWVSLLRPVRGLSRDPASRRVTPPGLVPARARLLPAPANS